MVIQTERLDKMKKLLLALFVFALGMMITSDEVFGHNLAGTVTVDSVNAQRGDHIAVGVRLNSNTHDLSALSFPIRYSEANLIFDSASFIGTVMTSEFTGATNTIDLPGVIKVLYLPNLSGGSIPSIQSPNGLIATLFFTVKSDAAPGNTPIDSVNIIEPIGN